MRKLKNSMTVIVLALSMIVVSCKRTKDDKTENSILSPENIANTLNLHKRTPFDSTSLAPFFIKYPQLNVFKDEVSSLYRKRKFHYVWFDDRGTTEVANLLHDKINHLQEEGIQTQLPYKKELDKLFEKSVLSEKPNLETELLLSSLYFFYANKVYKGIDEEKLKELGWDLPRKKPSFINYLDSIITNPSLIDKDEKEVSGQYYRLKEALQKYRDIEKKGGWTTIKWNKETKNIQPGDSSKIVAQIRHRLFLTGDLEEDSKKSVYDEELEKGVLKFKERFGYVTSSVISSRHIDQMNVPINARIRTIIVNMERCRWVSTSISSAREFLFINIPSYKLVYYKEGQPAFLSNVVVGKTMNKTAIFSADMKYIVFSPYWNIPQSIIKKEIEPGIAKNPNYLEMHNMEWNGTTLRQKPGINNSLGLVKFLFPNSESIYLHDTPSKSLFKKEKRAFSHGCIRIEKPKELAIELLKEDTNWTPAKIDSAMNGGKEKWYGLKTKIPVYIGYFTCWVDDDGQMHFYDDIYERDEQLATYLYE